MHYFTPKEVGEIIGTSGDTIRRLIRSEQLQAVRMPPGYHYKIAANEVLRYTAKHNLPLSTDNKKMLEEFSVELTSVQ